MIDGAAYYEAVASALEQARESVLVVGWEFDAGVRLRRDGVNADRLADLLESLVRRRRSLHVHVLEWDWGLLHVFQHGPIPFVARSRPSHRRIRYRSDGAHPAGASHHQKLVVVDDRLAFVGGLDLTGKRWDTPEHRANDARRVDPYGRRYAPFHDLAVAVDGEAAAALGALARERWRRGTGKRLRVRAGSRIPWPAGVEPDIEDVTLGLARTEPAYRTYPEVREVERLYLDAISGAERWIYIENQFLTSVSVAGALAARLSERDGPEVVIVITRGSAGWLEQNTMDALRTRQIRRLRACDERGRLRVCYPVVSGGDEERPIYVHAKAMVIDDAFARVGSANLSNRSMGFDTECDVAVESSGRPDVETAIGRFRNRLLAEHLGVSAERVGAVLRESRSLISVLDTLESTGRALRPLDREAPQWLMEALPDEEIVDPERPIDLREWLDEYLPEKVRRRARVNLRRIVLMAALSLVVVGLLSWTPVAETLQPGTIASAVPVLQGVAGPVAVAALYIVGGLLMVPLTVLTLATVFVYGPLAGFLYALLGGVLSAVCGYLIGRRLKRDTVRRVAGEQLNAISARLARRGILATVAVRLLPAFPFSVVNLIAGACRLRLLGFVLGSIVGVLPALAVTTLFADRLAAAIRDPNPGSFIWLGGVVALIVGGALAVAAGLRRRERGV